MKQIFLTIAFNALFLPTIFAQKIDFLHQVNARLEAISSIKNQSFCLDNSGFTYKNGIESSISSVRIDLEFNLTYKNTGKYPIILDKNSGTIAGYNLYQKTNDLSLRALEESTDYELLSNGESDKEGDYPSKRFIVLAQGQSYTNQSETRLLFDYPDRFTRYENKEHFISLKLFTIGLDLATNNNLDELRQKWSKTGYLWIEGVDTQLLLIRLPSSKELTLCKK